MAIRVSDKRAFLTEHYHDILLIVSSEVGDIARRWPEVLLSIEDCTHDGLMIAMDALAYVDLELNWRGYVKTVVQRELKKIIVAEAERQRTEMLRGGECVDEEVVHSFANDAGSERDLVVDQVQRGVEGRAAMLSFREQLTPPARDVFDVMVRPPLTLLIQARNRKGRVVRQLPTAELSSYMGIPARRVEYARQEIWKKAAAVAA
jgi:hypothetical protein